MELGLNISKIHICNTLKKIKFIPYTQKMDGADSGFCPGYQ